MSSRKTLNAKKILERAKSFLGISKDKDLVERLGIAQSTFSTWKTRGGIDLEAIFAICDGVDLNWLLFDEGEMHLAPEAEVGIEVVDLDLGPGDFTMRLVALYDDNEKIEGYIKATYRRLTVEEGEAEMRGEG